jgi:hypothetical protein
MSGVSCQLSELFYSSDFYFAFAGRNCVKNVQQ